MGLSQKTLYKSRKADFDVVLRQECIRNCSDDEEGSLKSAAEHRSTSDCLNQEEQRADVCTEDEEKVACGICFF